MNKLLLLATSLICLSLQSRGATNEFQQTAKQNQEAFKDSTLNGMADVKAGFRDLFESADEGINLEKLNPKAISFVQDYMDENSSRLNEMKSWGKRQFDMMNAVLTQHGIPVELKYLAVIESNLKYDARSWVGAVGPWQFMPQTAKELGLVVSKKRDDRKDYVKSTHAAAKYLTTLYGMYNDWLLVIAAYNCGPGNVNSAIRRSGSRNFWELQNHLPAESRNHVKKFIATHYIMEGAGGLTTLTKKETDKLLINPEQATDSTVTVITVTGKYKAAAIASALGMSLKDFNHLNPTFEKSLASKGSYDLRIPNQMVETFEASKNTILEQSLQGMLAMAR
ncbi:MAG TPA: lytic transglycosylase domain-containing protein [Flavisolibacter sp.]